MKKVFSMFFAVILAVGLTTSVGAYTITEVGFGANEDFSGDYWDDLGLTLLQKYDVDTGEWFAYTPDDTPYLYEISWSGSDLTAGQWSSDDPAIEYFSVKAGNPNSGGGYILYQIEDYVLGEWVDWDTSGLGDKDLSHIAWWGSDSGNPDDPNNPVPEPATLFLLGSGLVGAGVFRRKRNE